MDKLVEEFTLGGKLRTDRDAVEYALEHVDQFKPNTPKAMVERGGFLILNDKAGKSSPLYADRPYNSFENNLYLNQRFETAQRAAHLLRGPPALDRGRRARAHGHASPSARAASRSCS